jgi:SCF-associated factor 1
MYRTQAFCLLPGKYSKGALGLGDPADIEPGQPGGFLTEGHRQIAVNHRRAEPPDVDVPTEVRFDYGEKKRKQMFCFAATAAGWHMGALVIDLEVSFCLLLGCFIFDDLSSVLRQVRMMTKG